MFEVRMAEKFPQLMIDTKPQIQEGQRTPSKINTKMFVVACVIFKMQKIKDKEKILKEVIKEKTPYLLRNKDKNYVKFLLRNHACSD